MFLSVSRLRRARPASAAAPLDCKSAGNGIEGLNWANRSQRHGLLFGTGFINALGQRFWTCALHLAPAAAVTPFYYLMLVWALAIGFVVWGDVPTVSLLVGSAIVVATGLFLFLREAGLQRRLA
jgi:hypothetical protein